MLRKIALSTSLTFILAACGGGDDGGSNANSVNPSIITGSFKNATETGDYFARPDYYNQVDYHGSTSRQCWKEGEYYFESDRVQVYGSQSLPEKDFKEVAAWIESSIDGVAAKMNTTFDEVMETRRNIPVWVYQTARNGIMFKWTKQAIDYPNNFDSLENDDKERFANEIIVSGDTAFQVRLALDTYERHKQNAEEFNYEHNENYDAAYLSYTKKIRVCLHTSDSPFGYGEGLFNGINVAAPSVYKPKKQMEIIEHELVHMIQQGLAYTVGTNPFARWFSEGQAVYLSGQEVAHRDDHHAYSTPEFESYLDESGYDPAETYPHYALAYKYIQDTNSLDKLLSMIRDINHQGGYTNYLSLPDDYDYHYKSHPAFVLAWDKAGLVSEDGQPLTLNRFIDEYHTLMDK